MTFRMIFPLGVACAFMLTAFAANPVTVMAQEVPLTLEQKTSLRCAAAFAIIASDQARGEAAARAYPPLAERGREFFVRSSARLMDDTGMDRMQIAALMRKEAATLRADGQLHNIMTPCMIMLEASGV